MRRIPLAVNIAGGPDSTRSLSNFLSLVGITIFKSGMVVAWPFNAIGAGSLGCNSTGDQLIKSSDVAHHILWSPQYIQYFPLIFVAMIRPFSYLETTEPDFDHLSIYFPLSAFAKAGPYFVQ